MPMQSNMRLSIIYYYVANNDYSKELENKVMSDPLVN